MAFLTANGGIKFPFRRRNCPGAKASDHGNARDHQTVQNNVRTDADSQTRPLPCSQGNPHADLRAQPLRWFERPWAGGLLWRTGRRTDTMPAASQNFQGLAYAALPYRPGLP